MRLRMQLFYLLQELRDVSAQCLFFKQEKREEMQNMTMSLDVIERFLASQEILPNFQKDQESSPDIHFHRNGP